LTGAGVSTDSGLPDYRGPNGAYTKKGFTPMTYQRFLSSVYERQRYWARSMSYWKQFSSTKPNQIHMILSQLHKIHHIVTQNVDNLHYKAGSNNVTELHGSLYQVICLNCQSIVSRDHYQNELIEMNPTINLHQNRLGNPDGDVDMSIDFSIVKIPECKKCGGIMKPHIVFFGESVPKDRVELVQQQIKKADGLLAIGTSLQVYSAFRFVKYAHENHIPIVIINKGPTRGDDLSFMKFDEYGRVMLEGIV